MTSEKYGWLLPVAGPKLQAIEDVFSGMVCSLCEINPALVRPRWQPEPVKMPGHRENWCAFGILGGDAPGGSVWHIHGFSRLEVDQNLEILFSFYGPLAREKARALRDGLWVEQNRAILRYEHNIALKNMGAFQVLPEYDGQRWLMRCDLAITFVRGPEVVRKRKSEGSLDIKDIKSASPCGLCGRSR